MGWVSAGSLLEFDSIAVEEPSTCAALPSGGRWSRRLLLAFASSMILHVGVLTALAIAVWTPPELPALYGHRSVAGVELAASQPATTSGDVVEQLEQAVVVMPHEVQIGAQHFVPVEVALEVPPIDPALPLGAPPPSPEPSPSETSDANSPPVTETARPVATANESAPSSAMSAEPRTVGTDSSKPPRLIQNSPPVYPAAARAAGQEGTVVLRLKIDLNGRIVTCQVTSSSGHPLLDAAAVSAVRSWRFVPAMNRAGRPAAWNGRLPIHFVLD